MGTVPICLRAIFFSLRKIACKIGNLNSTIEYTSIDRSEKKITRFSLEKIANVNKPLRRDPCIHEDMEISGLMAPGGLNTQCMDGMDDTGQCSVLDLLELSTVSGTQMGQYIHN